MARRPRPSNSVGIPQGLGRTCGDTGRRVPKGSVQYQRHAGGQRTVHKRHTGNSLRASGETFT